MQSTNTDKDLFEIFFSYCLVLPIREQFAIKNIVLNINLSMFMD